MQTQTTLEELKEVLKSTPKDWLNLTTHRLDIYNESLAKVQFLEKFENLIKSNNVSLETLSALPTAFDYIRLGHPLSCVLEWAIAKDHNLIADQVISFDSQSIPAMAILRKNLLSNKKTLIAHAGNLPSTLNVEKLKSVYGYQFGTIAVDNIDSIPSFDGSIVFYTEQNDLDNFQLSDKADFIINFNEFGSIITALDKDYISEIQHVRRRESIAMTPANCYFNLQRIAEKSVVNEVSDKSKNKQKVIDTVQSITEAKSKVVVASSGLSMQYAIMMGLVDYALNEHPNKAIKFVVPPNCYGGTNDQARRVAACSDQIEIMDLPVDGENDMVSSVDQVLETIAKMDAVPFIIAEIPTNPRVEVPDLDALKNALSKERTTNDGQTAIDTVFILDQTFCPNVHFLGNNKILAPVKTISYVSGSKFPSGGKCTAGYAVANDKASSLMDYIEQHLLICDNEATPLQYEILAAQMPSMLDRINGAYKNTRDFVNFIEEELPEAKINFVSEELANQTFTPSVFSLDLPSKGDTPEEKEINKRELNLKLINMMINEIPTESKFCVSYGQLKGCYWTIPATSTQGTTKEGDKDYIVRVALSSDLDLKKHKLVFKQFVQELN